MNKITIDSVEKKFDEELDKYFGRITPGKTIGVVIPDKDWK